MNIKFYFTFSFFCLGLVVSGQSIDWITNDIFSDLGGGIFQNERTQNFQSYLVSAHQLHSSNPSGYLEISDVTVAGASLDEDNFIGNIVIGLTPTDAHSQGYKLRLRRFNGGPIVNNGDAPFQILSVQVIDASGTIIATQDLDAINTVNTLRINKTAVGVLEFSYNGNILATVTDAIDTYRAVISTTIDGARFSYDTSGFEITASSYPLPNVTDTNKNWTSVKTFDSQGTLTSASVGYFDELGRGIQAQTKDILTGKNWAVQTLYDSQGRPTVSTMSAPINSNLNFTYKNEFIKNAGGTNFSIADFEDNPELPSTVSDEAGTLGHYYSTQNTEEPYQDITDRPYTRTIYDDLNPGAVRAVVGGNSAQVAGKSGLQHNFPQGYSHSMPAAQELYYAFGKDYFPENSAGWFAAHNLGGYTDNPATYFLSHRATKTVAIDAHGNETVVFTDLEGRTLAAARSGGPDKYNVVSTIGPQGYIDVHLPIGTSVDDVTFLGGFAIYSVWDLRTGEQIEEPLEVTGGNIYRIKLSPQSPYDTVVYLQTNGVIGHTGEAKGIRYKVNYYDYALNYYDDAGNLLESVQPLGFDNSNLTASNANGVPNHSMISSYSYNSIGQLLNTSSPDEGTANFTYRKDGQIRFSQNTKQFQAGEFSYTNYDAYARPIESGVCADEYPGIATGNTFNLNLVASNNPSQLVVEGNMMTKLYNGWTTGAFHSQESYDNDFEISWKIEGDSTNALNLMMGLSSDEGSDNWQSIDYKIYLTSNIILAYKGATYLGRVGRYQNTDTFSITREGEFFIFYKNGEEMYQMELDPQHQNIPLVIDGNIFRAGAIVTDVSVSPIIGTTTTTNPGDTFEVEEAFCSERTLTLYDIPDQEGLDIVLEQQSSFLKRAYRQQQWLSGNVSKTWTESPETSTTWYSYDVYGRVDWMVQFINGLGTKTIDYVYDDITGEVTRVRYSGDQSEQFTHQYTYNQVGQLTKVETSYNGVNFKEQASYTYYETGALKRVNLAQGLQGIDYVYNISGALKSINHPSLSASSDPGGDANDVFGMIIDYHHKDYERNVNGALTSPSGTNRYDGNIKATRWAIDNDPNNSTIQQSAYTYTYDHNKWLAQANFGVANSINGVITPNLNSDYKVSNLSYDANGNILSLSRNKNTFNSSNAMDNFSYTYTSGTNQLNYVADSASTNEDAGDLQSQSDGNYIYNSIGQLVENSQDQIQYNYNTAGLVSSVASTGSSENLAFTYNDRGHRIKKQLSGVGNIEDISETYYVRDASGQAIAIYNGNTASSIEYPIYGASRLGISRSGEDRYELTDHLGNVRAVVKQPSNTTQESIVFADDFQDGNVAPWQGITGTPTIEDGKMRYTLLPGNPNPATYVDLYLQEGHQYNLSFLLKIPDPTKKNIIGISTLERLNVFEEPLKEGEYSFVYTANQSTMHRFYSRALGNSFTPSYIAYMDNVVVEDITPSDPDDQLLQAYSDYYPFGMAMPNRNVQGDYRYGYQGEYSEKDPETGLNAFELRMYDSRIGRWISPDPYGQYHSPYMAMDNRPVSSVDPSGGCTNARGEDCVTTLGGNATDTQGNNWSLSDGTWSLDSPIGLSEVFLSGGGSSNMLQIFGLPGQKAAPAINELSGFDHTIAEIQLNIPGIFGQRTDDSGRYQVDEKGNIVRTLPQTGMGSLSLIGGKGASKLGKGALNLAKKLIKSGKNGKLPVPIGKNPQGFTKIRGTKDFTHNSSGAIFKNSHSTHGSIHGNQWKAYPKGTKNFGKEQGNRITLDADGTIIGN